MQRKVVQVREGAAVGVPPVPAGLIPQVDFRTVPGGDVLIAHVEVIDPPVSHVRVVAERIAARKLQVVDAAGDNPLSCKERRAG